MNILNEIKNGNFQPLYDIYRKYRNEFIQWAVHNYSCTEPEARDIFQETIIRFYQNSTSGKLSVLTSDLKTYLWAIGKYQLLNLIKYKNRTVTFSSPELINQIERTDPTVEETEQELKNKELVNRCLGLLDDKSRRIIELYYLEGKDMASIAVELGYKNADVAKKKKYEVMKKLIALSHQNFNLNILALLLIS
ncbi:MAG TPA: sigma-70 family RNA polymerase sigma factor [Bacteroidia bacterium]|nr:sigma-70 family RNA polymerase sigma factor [Bacteroidia bacterium]